MNARTAAATFGCSQNVMTWPQRLGIESVSARAIRTNSGPVDRHLAAYWLKRAYEMSGREKPDGSLWHAFRRMWATERKICP